ncbi:hypothetical protein RSAG8_05293, partial [Rhizoctonia solani AG-8 WAC10335]
MPKDTNKLKENIPPKPRQLGKKDGTSVYPSSLAAPLNVPFAPVLAHTSQPALMDAPIQAAPNAQPLLDMGVVPDPQDVLDAQALAHYMGPYYQTCDPHMQAPLDAACIPAGPFSNVPNPYALLPAVPQHQDQLQLQLQSPSQPLHLPLPLSQLQLQLQPQPQIQDQLVQDYPQIIPGVPPVSLFPAPFIGQPCSAQTQGNQLGLWPLEHPPIPPKSKYSVELPTQLSLVDQYDSPAGIWPSTVQTRLEPGLHAKAVDNPEAKTSLGLIELCQISTCFKIGEQKQDGFRWVALLLPSILIEPPLDPIVSLSLPNQQCAWLLDPCARMEGREFLQFLDPEALMLRRKLHLRSRIHLFCEEGLDTQRLLWRMENWDESWKNVLCCSVTGVADPRSLALGTGLWATALYQLAFSPIAFETGPGVTLMRKMLATRLEEIGSRELGLPFLHPARLQPPSQRISRI